MDSSKIIIVGMLVLSIIASALLAILSATMGQWIAIIFFAVLIVFIIALLIKVLR